jgi:hypothetical protein
MNLREDINRIKEVMGINENRDMFFKRRQDEFLDVLLTSFEWMDEFIKDIDSFEDYLKLVLRHSIDGFFEFNDILVKRDEIEELLPFAFVSLRNDKRLFRKIKEHYDSKKYPTRDESDVTGINESRDIFFKRRQEEFLEDVLNSFDWMDVNESDSVEEYVEDILRHSIDSFFGYNNILVTTDEIAELLPTALKILRRKEQLYKQIKGYWYRNNSTSRIDESKELLLVKRRMDALLDYIEHSYDWLSPRAFTDFDHFLKRVVFSATRDFIADEIGGEYEEQLNIREKLEPMVLELIKKHSIYDEIYDHYISNR